MGIPHKTTYVETRFGSTHVITAGRENGKPVVLWHGLNANATTWVAWIRALEPTYRVYAVDAIGGMGKSAPSRPPKKGPVYGHWAAEALGGLGLRRANMIGASNGSWLIGKLGSVAPEMIASAILMSPAGLVRLSMVQALRMIPRVLLRPPAEAARQLVALLSPPDLPADPFNQEFLELMLASRFRSERAAPLLSDTELSQLAAPTYLLVGQYEASFNPYRAIKRGLSLLPHVITAEIVPGVGHTMVHRQPEWVIARAIGFLEAHAVEGHLRQSGSSVR
jgi:pimeloyl-ACP methyl ester carboxylesterase